MNILVKNIEQYNDDYVYFSEPIKNNIMNNGNFIRIIYSNSLVTFNGIYIKIDINHTHIDKYYNKYRCNFNVNDYKHTIEKIYEIEQRLLKKTGINGKTPQHKIHEQLKNGNIRVFSESLEQIGKIFILKIAGVWETENDFGLTYKFLVY
jgi:hypothetical protein